MEAQLGTCFRCLQTWSVAESHHTPYEFAGHIPMKSCFPLCEECWQALTPETRLPYYRQLFESWEQFGPQQAETWLLIDEAVRRGL